MYLCERNYLLLVETYCKINSMEEILKVLNKLRKKELSIGKRKKGWELYRQGLTFRNKTNILSTFFFICNINCINNRNKYLVVV